MTPPVPTPAAEATRADLREAIVATLSETMGLAPSAMIRSIADDLIAGPLATLIAEKAAAEAALAVAYAERDEARELVEHWKATAEAEADIGNERQADAATERARAERLKKALKPFAGRGARILPETGDDELIKVHAGFLRDAHAALTRPDDRTTTEGGHDARA